ncbi:MAG: pseudaminic acid cytidylyltransferase [Burkholderiaceae bacterium]|nr:pseudaminic acid cytidylyltransferase [Burkholderiaceae bacterium]
MRVAIIPARGGSKRIPRKNVKPFLGRPMIGYAIAAARDSGLFERIVVSTDDAEIAAVAREQGAETPFMRPPGLADDHTPTVPVIAQAIAALQAQGSAVTTACCIYPGVPLLQPDDLRQALHLLQGLPAGHAGYVFPVAAYPSPVQRALLRDADGASRAMQPQFTQTRTQDLEPAYFDAGQFYWAHASTWAAGLGIHAHAHTLVLPEWRVVDIDTPDDWRRAEALALALRTLE